MSLRQGVTATEEHRLKVLISKGTTWEEIVARCDIQDERGNPQVPLLSDVDLAAIKKSIYDPLAAKMEEAKAAGFQDIHSYEKSQRGEVAQKESAEDVEREVAPSAEVRGAVKDVAAGAGKPVDDLLGPAKKPGKK